MQALDEDCHSVSSSQTCRQCPYFHFLLLYISSSTISFLVQHQMGRYTSLSWLRLQRRDLAKIDQTRMHVVVTEADGSQDVLRQSISTLSFSERKAMEESTFCGLPAVWLALNACCCAHHS